MEQRIKRNFTITGLLLLAFMVFTVIVKTLDVKPIGPQQSTIGLGTVNGFLLGLFGESLLWYHITDLLGLIAILVAFCFAVVGLIQLITRRSLKRVDKSLFVLGGFYALIIFFYMIFEIFIINYRPVLMDGILEASYPSSHTMVVYCIMSTAIIQFHILVKNKPARLAFDTCSAVIIIVTVIGRLISGVHWFTDIIGGLLLGTALIMLYYSVVKLLDFRNPMPKNTP